MKNQKLEMEEVAETTAVAVAETTWPQTRAILRVMFIVLGVIAVVWVLYKLEGVLLLLVLSIFFAYLVAPLVEFVRRPFHLRGREREIARPFAIGIVYLVIFGSLTLAVWVLLPRIGNQITDFAKRAPTLQTTAQGRVQGLTGFCTRNEIPDNVCKAINGTLTSAIDVTKNYVTTDLPGLVVAVLGFIPWMILIPIMSFFLLKDVDSFRRSALQMLPRGRWRWRGDEFFQDVNSTLAAYIRAQLTACVLIGTICTIGFLIIGVPYALLLGILAGFLEFIPLVGPLVVVVVAALIASFNSVYDALWVILFLAVLRVIHDYAVYPRIIGQGIHLHPLAVILAILCGAELAGVAGIFLAIPVIAIATVSYRHWLEHKGSEGIVADILKPVETTPAAAAPPVAESRPPAPLHATPPDHPARDTTPEEMARARPDLTTGELKMPKLET